MKTSYSQSCCISNALASLHLLLPAAASSCSACSYVLGISNPNLYLGEHLKDCNFACLTSLSNNPSLTAIRLNLFQPGISNKLCFLAYTAHATGASTPNLFRGSSVTSPFSHQIITLNELPLCAG